MSIPDPRYPAATTRRGVLDLGVVRDVLAVVLLVLGAVGLFACLLILGFSWSDPAGYAVVSAAAIGLGFALAYRRR